MTTWQDVEEIALGLTGARTALSVKVSVGRAWTCSTGPS
jgi:hypothetical protein